MPTLPALNFGFGGGSAGPAGGGSIGSVSVQFGTFQVGGTGNTATSSNDADLPTTQEPSLATGLSSSQGEMFQWLLIGGLLLAAVYLVK